MIKCRRVAVCVENRVEREVVVEEKEGRETRTKRQVYGAQAAPPSGNLHKRRIVYTVT